MSQLASLMVNDNRREFGFVKNKAWVWRMTEAGPPTKHVELCGGHIEEVCTRCTCAPATKPLGPCTRMPPIEDGECIIG